MNKKNILVGQSGGPTAVINGSLYGVICEVPVPLMNSIRSRFCLYSYPCG